MYLYLSLKFIQQKHDESHIYHRLYVMKIKKKKKNVLCLSFYLFHALLRICKMFDSHPHIHTIFATVFRRIKELKVKITTFYGIFYAVHVGNIDSDYYYYIYQFFFFFIFSHAIQFASIHSTNEIKKKCDCVYLYLIFAKNHPPYKRKMSVILNV